jgi:hypothetical protein
MPARRSVNCDIFFEFCVAFARRRCMTDDDYGLRKLLELKSKYIQVAEMAMKFLPLLAVRHETILIQVVL